uniref:Uncharacterized protein n=1 Tax=Anguilla anguilla TaxID=7936 RepID=A0A0E9V385_ANGAN
MCEHFLSFFLNFKQQIVCKVILKRYEPNIFFTG